METQTFLHSKVRAYGTTVREDITRFRIFFIYRCSPEGIGSRESFIYIILIRIQCTVCTFKNYNNKQIGLDMQLTIKRHDA